MSEATSRTEFVIDSEWTNTRTDAECGGHVWIVNEVGNTLYCRCSRCGMTTRTTYAGVSR